MRSCGESRRRARLAAVAAVMVLGALAACSNYTEHAVRIRAALARGDWDAALEAADAIGDGSPLLRALERGTILHEAGRWERSDAEFDVADSLFDALYTRSVRRELAALAVSETIREYAGAPHEPLFVQFYQVLNRLRRGDVEGAGVECRQLAGWLQRLRDDPDDGIDDAPFLHYLCGVVFDRVGEREDALVSLRVAAAAYGRLGDVLHVEAPPRLACDTLRLSGDRGDAACPPPGPDAGTVLVLVEAGTVARLVEVGATVPIYRDDEWDEPEAFAGVLAARHGHEVDAHRRVVHWLRFAFPTPVADPAPVVRVDVRARRAGVGPGRGRAVRLETALASNVDALAIAAWRHRLPSLVARAIVRALVKYAAGRKAAGHDRALGRFVDLVGVVTERADTRAWSSLPSRIFVARASLPPGEWSLGVRAADADGRSRRVGIPGVRVRAGRLTVVEVRVR